MKLTNIENAESFMRAIDACKGKIELIGPDIRVNLKSKMTQLLSLARLFDADIELGDFEIIAYEPDDVLFLMQFLATG